MFMQRKKGQYQIDW